jgi:hypothetical protein
MRSKRGQVLVIFGLASVALFGVTALAIDGGRILLTQRALQNAADAAALSGAADIGPGSPAQQQGWARDDAIYTLEQSTGQSYSNIYGGHVHRLIGGAGSCVPDSCSDYNSNINWTDSTGNNQVSITTPYSYPGAVLGAEAYIHIDLVGQLPLVLGTSFWPSVAVHVQSTAMNYAIPYAMFMLKHDDQNDYNQAGSATFYANKRIGSNGSSNVHISAGVGTLDFICNASYGNQYGGDLYVKWAPSGNQIATGSIHEGACPAGAASSTITQGYIPKPNPHLPADPCLTATCGAAQSVLGAISVTGTEYLQPTRPLDPTKPWGHRYSSVSVASGNTLYLEPGVYFFEGTASGSGLSISSGGNVATGNCYGVASSSWSSSTCTTTSICGVTNTDVSTGVAEAFPCTANRDFGALLVFWPAGASPNPACGGAGTTAYPVGSTNFYCSQVTGPPASGDYNQLNLIGGGSLFLESSTAYHNVALFVDENRASVGGVCCDSWNFTLSTSLPATRNTTAWAGVIGNGSHVIVTNGGGSISVDGAIFAPRDNLSLGGSSSGDGYGQIIGYLLSFHGSINVNEAYNPLALAYSPVLVR